MCDGELENGVEFYLGAFARESAAVSTTIYPEPTFTRLRLGLIKGDRGNLESPLILEDEKCMYFNRDKNSHQIPGTSGLLCFPFQ